MEQKIKAYTGILIIQTWTFIYLTFIWYTSIYLVCLPENWGSHFVLH